MEKLQISLESIFDEFTEKFEKKRYTLKLKYQVEAKRGRILIFVRFFRKCSDITLLKAGMYCASEHDLDFLKSYLSGLSLTLAID